MENQKSAEELTRELLTVLGHDVTREGLKETPKRFVNLLQEFSAKKEFEFTTFSQESEGMIVQAGIPVHALCEHHLAPFVGTATVGYIPRGRMAGLSKLARTVEFFSRRLTNQERITIQVAKFLADQLRTPNVGVLIQAHHSCMSMRGVRAHGSITHTNELLGAFRVDPSTRSEFMAIHTNHG